MKIAFRLSALGFGGTERVFLSVANYLAAQGHQIDFVVDKANGQSTEETARQHGHRVVSLDVNRTWHSIKPFASYLNEAKPDVYVSAYTETNAAALLSSMLAKHNAVKVITEHASLNEHWANKPLLRKAMLELIVRVGYRAADRILCVSAGMVEQLKSRLQHPLIGHIHNPVRFKSSTRTKSQARMALGIDDNAKVVIAVGRVSRQKNYLMLLQAVAALKGTPGLAVYIIGGVYETAQKEILDAYISEHDLGGLVHFVDFTHDLHAYYESADTLALCSAWEGFGNVLVEALAFGLQVVSTDCNHGPAEILANGKYGELVAVDDHAAMARAIQQSLVEPKRNRDVLIARANEFSEERIGAAYEVMIKEALEAKQ